GFAERFSVVIDLPPSPARTSVAQLGPPARDVLLELAADRRVHGRLLVLLQRLRVDLPGALGCVAAAQALPPLVVLGRREQGAVEAFAEALERVDGTEEVAACTDLLVGAECQALLVDLERRELHLQHAEDLDVDDELLVAGDEPGL